MINLIAFELHQLNKRWSTWLLASLPILVGYFWGFNLGTNPEPLDTLASLAIIFANSLVMPLIVSLIMIPLALNSALRDYKSKVSDWLYSYPVQPRTLFTARVLALVAVSANISGLALLAMALGYLADDNSLAIHWAGLFNFWLFYCIPALFVGISLVLVFALRTKKELLTYIGFLALTSIGDIVGGIVDSSNPHFLLALISPYGAYSFEEITRQWGSYEFNNNSVLMHPWFIANRVLWLAIAVGALWYGFAFSQQNKANKTNKAETTAPLNRQSWQAVLPNFQVWQYLKADIQLSAERVIKTKSFAASLMTVALFGCLMTYFPTYFLGTAQIGSSDIIYLTLTSSVSKVLPLLLVFLAGELVHPKRESGFYQVMDALPHQPMADLLGKYLALVVTIVCFMAALLLTALALQFSKGVWQVQWQVYLIGFFGYQLWHYALIGGFFIAVHSLIGKRYVALITALAWYYFSGLVMFGLGYTLPTTIGLPPLPYSELNGWHHSLSTLWQHGLTWTLASLALLMCAIWLRSAGKLSISQRAKQNQHILGRKILLLPALLVGFIASYGFNIYQEVSQGGSFAKHYSQALLADYEKTFVHLESTPMPVVSHWQGQIELYPSGQAYRSKGELTLTNPHNEPVSDVLLSFWVNQQDDYSYTFPSNELVLADDKLHTRHYRLLTPLAPGDTTAISFEINANAPQGTLSLTDTSIVNNGSFINAVYLKPTIGFDSSILLHNERERFGLPERNTATVAIGLDAREHSVFAGRSEGLTLDVTVSTEADQTVRMPGQLNKLANTADGRANYRFITPEPINDFVVVTSGNYQVTQDNWQNVQLELLYAPAHKHNVPTMLQAMHDSLDYFSQQFAPYQFDHLRIIEVPRYHGFAQSFAGTVPFGEDMGFTSDVNTLYDVNVPYYITAHEIAHQWWGHQLVSAQDYGSYFLIESLAEYSANKVVEHNQGIRAASRLRREALDTYLQSFYSGWDDSLMEAYQNTSSYVHYEKGKIVLAGIADIVGEAVFNSVLAELIDQHGGVTGPFATSEDFYNLLSAKVPGEYNKYVYDVLHSTMVQDNQVLRAEQTSQTGDSQTVRLRFKAKQTLLYRDTSMPAYRAFPLSIAAYANDPAQSSDSETAIAQQVVSVFGSNSTLTSIDDDTRELSITLPKDAKYIMLDPHVTMIDQAPGNNIMQIN